MGLELWTVQLPTAADVAAVRARVDAAGIPVHEADGGFLVHDPWRIPVRIVLG